MEREKFMCILRELEKTCRAVNKGLEEGEENNEVIYEVLQFSDLAKKWNSVQNITDFYNYNWLGNIDFMHIPNFRQTLENCKSYPIIIARKKGTDEILGISTIKYDENTEDKIDPYFPEKDTNYFSITGILTRRNNVHRGIGKKIYEIALRGAYNYEKEYPGTKMMCVIDCRNRQSLRALASSVENINTNGYVGEGRELPVHIIGYYELRSKEEELLEAPTLVVEIKLESREQIEAVDSNKIEYENNGEDLFNSLLETLRSKLERYGISEPVVQEDVGCGMVYFYSLEDKEKCNIQGITIESNDTEKGNDRIPRDDREMREFMGPMPAIWVEDER